MKIFFIGFLMVSTVIYADDLTTKSGIIYKDYKINKVTSRGVEVFHSGGVATVPFSALPDNIRAQYADTERKLIEQKKAKQEKQEKDSALQKISRPIILMPMRKAGENVICKWSEKNISYNSIEDALSDASPYMKQKYKEAKQEKERLKSRTHEEKRKDAYEQMDAMYVAQGRTHRPYEQMPVGPVDPMPLLKWMSDMNYILNSQSPYPKSSTIMVQDLPKNTISDVSVSTMIYFIDTVEKGGIIYPLYTTDKNKALELIQKQGK